MNLAKHIDSQQQSIASLTANWPGTRRGPGHDQYPKALAAGFRGWAGRIALNDIRMDIQDATPLAITLTPLRDPGPHLIKP